MMSEKEEDVESRVIDFCNAAELSNSQCDALLQTLGELCSCLEAERKEKGRGKTPYQQFASACLKNKIAEGMTAPEAMKSCAADWKRSKAGGKG